jgi:hypothetical protein
MRSLPRAYEEVSAPVGTSIAMLVTGDAGGTWRVERAAERWRLVASASADADAIVELPADAAWRLMTRAGDVDATRLAARVRGARELGQRALGALAVMTTRS